MTLSKNKINPNANNNHHSVKAQITKRTNKHKTLVKQHAKSTYKFS
jgi:hypothetical protein